MNRKIIGKISSSLIKADASYIPFHKYNPLINYDWSTKNINGLRYLTDKGKSPKYDAQLYFGQGVYFNGVDQGIKDIPYTIQGQKLSLLINAVTLSNTANQYIYSAQSNPLIWRTSSLIRVYINGVNHNVCYIGTATSIGNIALTVDEGIFKFYLNGVLKYTAHCGQITTTGFTKLGYDGSSYAYSNGILKDVFMFNRVLTQSDITQSHEQPEAFYAMAQDDSTCVLNMPMCENDGYVRNMRIYAEGNNLILNSTFDADVLNWTGSNATTLSVNGQIEVTGTATVPANVMARSNNLSIVVGKKYLLECDITQLSSGNTGFVLTGFTFDINGLGYYYPHTLKKHYLVLTATATVGNISLHSGTAVGSIARFDNVYVKELNGIHSIQNYTTACRMSAQNLSYGLQTCKFKRDSLGVIKGVSQFLECKGIGYVNTGYVPANVDWSIEFIGKFTTSISEQTHGTQYTSPYNRIVIGSNIYGGLFARCGGDILVFTSATQFDISNNLTIVYESNVKKFRLYRNGVFVVAGINTNFNGSSESFYLGSQGAGTYPVTGDVRLFKVHDKALTQAEITKNYNSYVAKGLLA